MFIDEELEFVKSQIQHHQKTIKFLESKSLQAKVPRHEGILRRFNEMLPKMFAVNEEITKLESKISELEQSSGNLQIDTSNNKIGNRLGDIDSLPAELRSQLVSVQYDESEHQIMTVVRSDLGGIATIDEILVGIYQNTGEVQNRENLAQKIYRMTRKELLFSVEGRKGVYSIAASKKVEPGSDS